MSVRPQQQPDSQFINNLLSANFQMMEGLGEPVLKPFLQASTRSPCVCECFPTFSGDNICQNFCICLQVYPAG